MIATDFPPPRSFPATADLYVIPLARRSTSYERGVLGVEGVETGAAESGTEHGGVDGDDGGEPETGVLESDDLLVPVDFDVADRHVSPLWYSGSPADRLATHKTLLEGDATSAPASVDSGFVGQGGHTLNGRFAWC